MKTATNKEFSSAGILEEQTFLPMGNLTQHKFF